MPTVQRRHSKRDRDLCSQENSHTNVHSEMLTQVASLLDWVLMFCVAPCRYKEVYIFMLCTCSNLPELPCFSALSHSLAPTRAFLSWATYSEFYISRISLWILHKSLRLIFFFLVFCHLSSNARWFAHFLAAPATLLNPAEEAVLLFVFIENFYWKELLCQRLIQT